VPLLGALLLAGPATAAAEPSRGAIEIKPVRTSEVPNGSLAVVRGRIGAEGQRFALRNLTMTKPVAVLLLPGNPRHDMRISFAKTTLEDPDLEGSTAAEGHYLARFRTAQDVALQVRTANADAAPFLLLVWVGDELKSQLPTQVLSRTEYEARGGGEARRGTAASVAWSGLGLVLLIALIVSAIRLVRRSRASA
jgi:alpha-D-ribose 1-methylphosphonate 5-triphosphate synthase subunit PhnG